MSTRLLLMLLGQQSVGFDPIYVSLGLTLLGMAAAVFTAYGMMKANARWMERALNGLAHVPAKLGTLEAIMTRVEQDVQSIREWKHGTSNLVMRLDERVAELERERR